MKRKTDKTKNQASDLFFQEDIENLMHMVNSVNDELLIIDRGGKILFSNEAASRGFGYSQKYLQSRTFVSFLKERTTLKEWQADYFESIKKSKKPVSYVINRISKNKSVQKIDVTAIYRKQKDLEYILCVLEDVTELFGLERDLEESKELYLLLSEQAVDGIFMLDLKGHVVYCNKSAGRTLGLSPQKIEGIHFSKMIAKDSVKKARKCFSKVSHGISTVCEEIDIINKKGEVIPTEFTGSPIRKNEKIFRVHTIVRDVRKRKQLESLVIESEKMKALEHFISGTTQEIHYPLKGLARCSKNLIDKYKDRDFEYIGFKEFKDIMRTLETMQNQLKYCHDTTARMLSLQKKRIGIKLEFCDVNKVIHETVNALNLQLEVSNVDVKIDLKKTVPLASIGAIEFSLVITNIITNALQSVVGRGKITMKTFFEKESKCVRIDCLDNGVGIPKDNLSRIFEPFFSTKERGLEKSSGLGLSIVYAIVKSYGGDIEIKSSVRKGTKVSIFLPQKKN